MKETAAELSLSPKTVENYWVRIYAKTGRTSQLAVVARLWDMEAV
jgi:DNA-binding NarL/FixJ family response regulator